MSILDTLGLDPRTAEWTDLAACKNVVQVFEVDGERVVFDPLFDDYEEDMPPHVIRKYVDRMCNGCPVQKQCLEYGMKNSEPGVWGGVYLTYGKADRTRNEHKTPEVWETIAERTGVDVVHQ